MWVCTNCVFPAWRLSDDAVIYSICGAASRCDFRCLSGKKVAKQMENSKRLGVEVDYKFDEEGIETTTSYDSGKAPWDMFKKAASTKKNLIIYDGQKRAVILPVHQMGEQKEAVVELIRKHMPPSAVKIRRGFVKK